MGNKGPCGCAAADGVEYRRLHLHVPAVVQEIAQILDKCAAHLEIPPDLRIDDQVHIPLTVAGFLIGQAVELLRQGQQGFGQQGNFLHAHAHFSPLGTEDLALDPHDIADIVFSEPVVYLGVHFVLPGVELDTARPVLEVAEADLSHTPFAHQPSRDGDLITLQLFKLVFDLLGVVAHNVLSFLEGVPALLLQGAQLFPADTQDFAQVLLLFVCLLSHTNSVSSFARASVNARSCQPCTRYRQLARQQSPYRPLLRPSGLYRRGNPR